jgi:hypothetical protein
MWSPQERHISVGVVRFGEHCIPPLRHGMWFAPGVLRPRFVGAQSKEPRPSAATMRRRPAQPADPVPPARAPQASSAAMPNS